MNYQLEGFLLLIIQCPNTSWILFESRKLEQLLPPHNFFFLYTKFSPKPSSSSLKYPLPLFVSSSSYIRVRVIVDFTTKRVLRVATILQSWVFHFFSFLSPVLLVPASASSISSLSSHTSWKETPELGVRGRDCVRKCVSGGSNDDG